MRPETRRGFVPDAVEALDNVDSDGTADGSLDPIGAKLLTRVYLRGGGTIDSGRLDRQRCRRSAEAERGLSALKGPVETLKNSRPATAKDWGWCCSMIRLLP